MTRQEARRWMRNHFAEYIDLSEPPDDAPPLVQELWRDETLRIASRITRTSIRQTGDSISPA